MLNLELSWPEAAVAAGSLAAGASLVCASRTGPASPRSAVISQECALVLGLIGAVAASWLVRRDGAGRRAGQGTVDLARRADRALAKRGKPAAGLMLPHPLLVEFFNLYYASLHFPVLIGCMIWRVFSGTAIITGSCWDYLGRIYRRRRCSSS